MVGASPFEEVDPGDSFRAKPDAIFHLIGSQTLPPAASLLLGQICKWAFLSRQVFDLCEDFSPCGGDKAGANTRCVAKFFAYVKADDQRIETVRTWCLPADNELLAEIDPVLRPDSRSHAGLVHTIAALCYDSFQTVGPNKAEHLGRGLVGNL
jgi:hypothetical protein